MRNLWFISDTHFGHSNFLNFTNAAGEKIRKFNTTEEMDETMIANWNSVVKDGDHVWHLGDVSFRYNSYLSSIMHRLKGKKRLIVGNHDKVIKSNLLEFFEKVEYWRLFKDSGFVCSHVPMRTDQFRYKVKANVHGHIHAELINEPEYINICVEHTNYTPVHLDEIIKRVDKI